MITNTGWHAFQGIHQGAYNLYRSTRRFGSLDGWRAIAILAVIFHHTLAEAFATPIAQEGRRGVTLFFVISGFLIVTLLLRSKDQGTFSLRSFWGRRMLRIFPVYYGTLILYILLVPLTEHTSVGHAFFLNLPFFATFTTNWFVVDHARTIFFFSWSLAAEEQFYLCWPLVEVLVTRSSHKLLLLGLTIIVTQYVGVVYGFSDAGPLAARITYNIPLAIVLGTILAHVLHDPQSYGMAYALFGRRGSAIACLMLACGSVVLEPQLALIGELVTPVAFTTLIGACVIREDNDLAKIMHWSPLVLVGTVSYGMYMIHMLSVNLIRRGEHVANIQSLYVDFVGGAILAFCLAAASYFFYERRFLLLNDRLFPKVATQTLLPLGRPLPVPQSHSRAHNSLSVSR
jgi:peptidoglycan/LPS O-acetylase OafA/YrhL